MLRYLSPEMVWIFGFGIGIGFLDLELELDFFFFPVKKNKQADHNGLQNPHKISSNRSAQ